MLMLVAKTVRINVFRSSFGITWNVDAIKAAIVRGDFGRPKRHRMRILPPMSEEERANIDWEKVGGLMLDYRRSDRKTAAVRIPAIQVIFQQHGEDFLRRVFVDGNHRVTARRELGMDEFASYVVPPELERLYRIEE